MCTRYDRSAILNRGRAAYLVRVWFGLFSFSLFLSSGGLVTKSKKLKHASLVPVFVLRGGGGVGVGVGVDIGLSFSCCFGYRCSIPIIIRFFLVLLFFFSSLWFWV